MLLNNTVMVKVPVRLQGLEIKDLETLRKEIHPDIVDFVRDNEMNILFRFLKSRDHIDLANQIETLQQNCSNLTDAQIFEKTCQILGVEYNQAFNAMFFKENGDRLDSVSESKSEEKSSKNDYKDLKNMVVQVKVFQDRCFFKLYDGEEYRKEIIQKQNKCLKDVQIKLNQFLQTLKQEQIISIQSETTSMSSGDRGNVIYEYKLILTYRCPLNEIEND